MKSRNSLQEHTKSINIDKAITYHRFIIAMDTKDTLLDESKYKKTKKEGKRKNLLFIFNKTRKIEPGPEPERVLAKLQLNHS